MGYEPGIPIKSGVTNRPGASKDTPLQSDLTGDCRVAPIKAGLLAKTFLKNQTGTALVTTEAGEAAGMMIRGSRLWRVTLVMRGSTRI